MDLSGFTIEQLKEAIAAREESGNSQNQPQATPQVSRNPEQQLVTDLGLLDSGVLAQISEARSVHTIPHGSKTKLLDACMSYLLSLNK